MTTEIRIVAILLCSFLYYEIIYEFLLNKIDVIKNTIGEQYYI